MYITTRTALAIQVTLQERGPPLPDVKQLNSSIMHVTSYAARQGWVKPVRAFIYTKAVL